YLFERIQSLPDVRIYWESAPPKQAPSGNIDPVVAEKFKGVPKFPANPPTYFALPAGAERHACMGLNACKGQDRFGLQGHEDPKSPGHYVQNSCAGQGYRSTALNYLGEASDHSCHVMNGCKHQGGCGLYGTAHEQSRPGFNSCKSLGSC